MDWMSTTFDNGDFLIDGEREHYYYEDDVVVKCHLGFQTEVDHDVNMVKDPVQTLYFPTKFIYI